MTASEILLDVRSLSKCFDGFKALDSMSLTVKRGEFVCLLGRNGSGKSTFLKILSGTESKSTGQIMYRGQPLIPATERQKELVMVWQSLALFPHMNVADNVGFGLSIRKVSKKEIATRVEETLNKVGLSGYGCRKIHELSGGEQQRVALARALVLRPAVLLLDEPFGAIDIQLRSQLQALLRDIHRNDGLTIIMVTHDIPEALALANRIVLLDHGRVQQVGTADDLMHRPCTAKVAGFMGQKNVFSGTISSITNDIITVSTTAGEFRCKKASWIEHVYQIGQEVACTIDAARMSLGADRENQLKVEVESRFILGALTIIRANAFGIGSLRCEVYNADSHVGVTEDSMTMSWSTIDAFALPLELSETVSAKEVGFKPVEATELAMAAAG